MTRLILCVAAILGGLAVLAGAFAAHAVKGTLTERSQHLFETAARYQMYHALALLAVGLIAMYCTGNNIEVPTWLRASGWLFIVGIVLFSGSLYTLALTNIPLLGVITPIGGVALIGGWITLAIASVKL